MKSWDCIGLPKETAVSSVSIKENGAKICVSEKIMKDVPKLASLVIGCGFVLFRLLFFNCGSTELKANYKRSSQK